MLFILKTYISSSSNCNKEFNNIVIKICQIFYKTSVLVNAKRFHYPIDNYLPFQFYTFLPGVTLESRFQSITFLPTWDLNYIIRIKSGEAPYDI